jgi:hypothetical protein
LFWSGGFLFIAIWKAGLGIFFTVGLIILLPMPLYLLILFVCHPRSRRHCPKPPPRRVLRNGDWVDEEPRSLWTSVGECCGAMFIACAAAMMTIPTRMPAAANDVAGAADAAAVQGNEEDNRYVRGDYELAAIDEDPLPAPSNPSNQNGGMRSSSSSYSYTAPSQVPSNLYDILPSQREENNRDVHREERPQQARKEPSTPPPPRGRDYAPVPSRNRNDDDGIRVSSVSNAPNHSMIEEEDDPNAEIPLAYAYALPVVENVTVVPIDGNESRKL